MKRFGIDISKWQGNFDFKKALKEGVSFAVIKGGGNDDGLYTDPMFEQNYSSAKAVGLPVGVYWFSKALSCEEAVTEADYLINNILKNKQFELPIYIDVEHKEMLDLGKDQLTKTVDKFCSYLEQKGYFVGIYSSVYSFSKHMDDEVLKKYTHWVAQWAKECTYNNTDVLGMWQFGGETNLIRNNYIAGNICDQNYMYIDFPQIIKEKKLNGFSSAPSIIDPKKKTDEEIANEVIDGKWGNGAERKNKIKESGYDYETVQSIVNRIKNDTTLKVGDLVRMSPDGTIYGSEKKFAPFVYTNLLYIRDLDGSRAVISIQAEGAVTGAVNVKHLKKHKT